MTEARLFSRHSIGTRIAALFMLLILVITAAMTYVSISVSTNELLDSSTEYTEQLIRRVNAEHGIRKRSVAGVECRFVVYFSPRQPSLRLVFNEIEIFN